MYLDVYELLENCKRLANKEILVYGERKSAEYWFNVALNALVSPAVNWVAEECEIVIDGVTYNGIVMIHSDGRVYPMMRDSYEKIYGDVA